MSGARISVDANLLVYAYDASARDKHRIARKELSDLWDSGEGLISTQVLQEFYVTITKKVPRPVGSVLARVIIQDLLQWRVVINDGQSILDAIDIQRQHRLDSWDALIIQSAIKGGAEVLLSEDFEAGRLIEGVRITNPF